VKQLYLSFSSSVQGLSGKTPSSNGPKLAARSHNSSTDSVRNTSTTSSNSHPNKPRPESKKKKHGSNPTNRQSSSLLNERKPTYAEAARPSPLPPSPVNNHEEQASNDNNANRPRFQLAIDFPSFQNLSSMPEIQSLLKVLEREASVNTSCRSVNSESESESETEMDPSQPLQKRILHLFENSNSDNSDDIFDVKFLIGADEFPVDADRLTLSLFCDNLPAELSGKELIHWKNPIVFPNLDKEGFQGMLDYMYCGEFEMQGNGETEQIKHVLSVLASANECGCRDLITICKSYFEGIISLENAAEIYNLAYSKNIEDIKEHAFLFISKYGNYGI